MSEAKFQIGDVVTLNSGGEKMTVERVETSGIGVVFVNRDGIQRAFLPAVMFKNAAPERAGTTPN